MNTKSERVIRLRLPRALVSQLSAKARQQGMPVNSLILRAIASDLGRVRRGGGRR